MTSAPRINPPTTQRLLPRGECDAVLLRVFSAVERKPFLCWQRPDGTRPAARFSLPEHPEFRLALPFVDLLPVDIGQFGSDIASVFHDFRTFDTDILMPPDYSLGRFSLKVFDPYSTGVPALKFDEIHSSTAFRHIKPRPQNPYREWNYWGIRSIIGTAVELGISEFFASTPETIADRYRRIKIMENNLQDNYLTPFRSGWDLVTIMEMGKEERAWHYEGS
ncbi:MAG: hypothetical protein WC490_01755 [Candidatus Margulisiibacteriota bacterium]